MIKDIKYKRIITEIDNKLSSLIMRKTTVNDVLYLEYYDGEYEVFWSNMTHKRIRLVPNFDYFLKDYDLGLVKERIKSHFKMTDYIWIER